MAASKSLSLKEYLKKYENTNEVEKKKKKKSKIPKKDPMGVLVVDEDPVWHKPVNVENEDEDDSADEEKPQVNEDIEVKRMKRMEQIRSLRPYDKISEDGSGWISVSDTKRNLSSNNTNLGASLSRERRTRYDTPSPEAEPNPSNSENQDADLSPPRQRRKRVHTPSLDGEVNPTTSKNKDADLSPPRQRHRRALTSSPKGEVNPAKYENKDADLSPPRQRRRRVHTPSPEPDLSPPRKSSTDHLHSESLDLSPPRRTRGKSAVDSLVSDLSPPRKKKSGLISAQEIKKEVERDLKDEISRFKKMDPSVSGRAPERIYRDKEGRRLSKEEVAKLEKVEEKPKEVKLEWGKGLVQKREAEAKMHDLEAEKEKPFARTRDDPQLDNMLKERIRWGDPMAHLVKRKQPEMALGNLGDDEKMRESGFMIPQDIPSHSWIKRKIDPIPNRYGIKPGRHWDGVNRSNGTEAQFFKRMNEKQATEKEAYLWSVADM
ncbi:hypothetical protein MKW94_002589 [Papaver nudicaule]|uniref:BUD13 homolog n=1 Tax=Papaver nudicaule TaxID=74823 RepID=A0AA42B4U5_PAPNU|nr:hypothetical protein [Papaver nudicaule]